MKTDKKPRAKLGGKSAFNWKFFAYALPIFIVRVPLTENQSGIWWTFWRWTFVAILAAIPLTLLYLLGDFYFFYDRIKNPMPDWMTFLYGAILGGSYGIAVGVLAYAFKLKNLDFLTQSLEYLISGGLTGALLMPLSSLVSNSVEIYSADRDALIAERMHIESQKAESKAVIDSLKSSMSNKVDENLLEIIENSKEYFNTKSRSLEENWELLAVQLRKAALETIRPFSHRLHRRGSEKTYRVNFSEIASYIAYKFEIHIFWTLFIFFVLNYHTYVTFDNWSKGMEELLIRGVILFLLLIGLKIVRRAKVIRNVTGFLIAIVVTSVLYVRISDFYLGLSRNVNETLTTELTTEILLSIVVFIVSLSMAFLYGGHAEIDFLERRISEEQLETMLLRREEARISRELAKYLHGTIQSRLMASAIGVESAGRRGDKKALKREVASAYRNLKVPSASYFSNPEASLNEEIKKVIEKWKDLMAIKLTVAKNLPPLAENLIQDIGNAVNEALSNAFRHGSASKVEIKVAYRAGNAEIEVSDNGIGPTSGKGGLGSEWFDALAGNKWQLESNSKGGATLTLQIPINQI